MDQKTLRQACRREVDNYLAALNKNGLLESEMRAALDALSWFSRHAPLWAQPLRLTPGDRFHDAVTWPEFVACAFSFSLWSQCYDYRRHPSFYDYGCGLTYAMPELRNDLGICLLLPPRELPGLDAQFCWRPLR
jgi:hypothetical protein